MPSLLAASAALLAASQTVLAGGPTWPTPELDELEDVRFLQAGYNRRGFSDFVSPCSFSSSGNGRITAAEWIRTAYHDMATANVVEGTGGLDASIQFETDRGENVGAAMNDTLRAMVGYYTPRSSVSDLLALGVFVSVGNCGGPLIPYRIGRIDAVEAGPTGVPEPTDNITTLTAKFARQGFNTAEMIGLVACGHTLGGVHGEDFPTVVPGNGTAGNNFSHFDTTTAFDARVAIEYVAGNTTNPLVVGPDGGMNSDLTVFVADGNKTIEQLANGGSNGAGDTFQITCASLLERMVNTVPSTVKLSDPLVPYPVKPADLVLTLSDDGANLTFSGAIRIRTTERPAAEIAEVTLQYLSRDDGGGGSAGNFSSSSSGFIATTAAMFQGGSTVGFGENFQWYEFESVLKASTSISAFNVSITLINGTVEEHNNNGAGFPVQSGIILQASRTCRIANSTGSYFKIVAAVHDSRKDLPATVMSHVRNSRSGSVVPIYSVVHTSLSMVNATGAYDFFSAVVSLGVGQIYDAYVDLVSGEANGLEADLFNSMGNIADCD